MTGFTIRRCALVTPRVTFDTVNCNVRTGQWEIGLIMIKRVLRITRRMAGKACGVFIDVSVYACMLRICFGGGMADDATEDAVIVRVGMTICTLVPYAFVVTTINREIVVVVIFIAGGGPCILCMAGSAIGREVQRDV